MDKNIRKLVIWGAGLVIAGLTASGPLMVFTVEHFNPQPAWVDAGLFASHYHWSHALPYWFGLLLLIGNVLFTASVCRLPGIKDTVYSSLALTALAVYGSLVSFNYLIQVAYVPAAVRQPNELLAALSMANPASICWVFEMFAYAFQGAALWLISGAFRKGVVNRIIKYSFIINGIGSIAGAVVASIDHEWVFEPGSIAGYVIWNILMTAIMVLVIISMRKKQL